MTPTQHPFGPSRQSDSTHDSLVENFHFRLRWPAVFAGALVALLAYATLAALGLGFSGEGLRSVLRGSAGSADFGFGAALWLVVAVVASLFFGGFISGRVGGLAPVRVGRLHGLVVAALFFAFLFSQAGAVVGSLGPGLGSVAQMLSGGGAPGAQSVAAQEVLNEAIGDLALKSPAEVVVRGLATRLIRGDESGARIYLARQAGITRADAKARIETVRAQFDAAVLSAGSAAAAALTVAGWTLFAALLLGSIASAIGGGVGAARNLRASFSSLDQRPHRQAA